METKQPPYAIKEIKLLIESLESADRQLEEMRNVICNLTGIINNITRENERLREHTFKNNKIIAEVRNVMHNK